MLFSGLSMCNYGPFSVGQHLYEVSYVDSHSLLNALHVYLADSWNTVYFY